MTSIEPDVPFWLFYKMSWIFNATSNMYIVHEIVHINLDNISYFGTFCTNPLPSPSAFALSCLPILSAVIGVLLQVVAAGRPSLPARPYSAIIDVQRPLAFLNIDIDTVLWWKHNIVRSVLQVAYPILVVSAYSYLNMLLKDTCL